MESSVQHRLGRKIVFSAHPVFLWVTLSLCAATASAQITIDSEGLTGQDSAVAIGQDNLPIIAYKGDDGLNVIHCDSSSCAAFTAYPLGPAAPSATEISMAIRTDGRPLIAFYSLGSIALEIFNCADTDCSTGSRRKLESSNRNGRYTSMVIRDDGRPMIAYQRASGDRSLAVYDCIDEECSDGTIRILDTSAQNNNLGTFTDIAMGAGLPIISYIDDFPNNQLKIYRCSDVNCASGSSRVAGSGASTDTQIVLPSDGRPLVTFYSGRELIMVDCLDIDCAQTQQRSLDNNFAGAENAMTINADGLAVISYYDATNRNLKTYACDDLRCTSGKPDTIDSHGEVGRFSALSLRPGEGPIITYQDGLNSDLKVFACPDQGCAIQIFDDSFETATQ